MTELAGQKIEWPVYREAAVSLRVTGGLNSASLSSGACAETTAVGPIPSPTAASVLQRRATPQCRDPSKGGDALGELYSLTGYHAKLCLRCSCFFSSKLKIYHEYVGLGRVSSTLVGGVAGII